MKQTGSDISYRYERLDRGVQRVLQRTDHVQAVHDSLRFHITDHRTNDPSRLYAIDVSAAADHQSARTTAWAKHLDPLSSPSGECDISYET
jgi:hypothetical protein